MRVEHDHERFPDFPRVQAIPGIGRASLRLDGVRAPAMNSLRATRASISSRSSVLRALFDQDGAPEPDRPRASQVGMVRASERRRDQFLGRQALDRHPDPPPLRPALP